MSTTAQDGYVVLAPQTAKGTPNATLGAYGLRVTSSNTSGQSELLDDDPEIGGGRDNDTSAATMGGFSVAGDLEGAFRPSVVGLLLKAAGFQPGAPVQDAATGAWSHTFVPSTFTYLTVEGRWGNTDAIRRFSDVLVNEFSVNLEANGKASWSASLLGSQESWQGTPSVPTFETDPIANYAGSAVTLDGLGTYRFESVGLTIANNLSDDEYVIGSRFLDDVTPGGREVTMSGTIKVGNNTPKVTDLYRAAVYGSKAATAPGGSDPYHSAGAITFGNPRLIGTSILKRFGMIATIPDLVLSGFPLEASGEDRLTVDIEGRAYKGAGDVLSVVLQNSKATPYT